MLIGFQTMNSIIRDKIIELKKNSSKYDSKHIVAQSHFEKFFDHEKFKNIIGLIDKKDDMKNYYLIKQNGDRIVSYMLSEVKITFKIPIRTSVLTVTKKSKYEIEETGHSIIITDIQLLDHFFSEYILYVNGMFMNVIEKLKLLEILRWEKNVSKEN